MFLGIIGNIGVAVCPLDEDKLVGFLDDVVFIFEQDDVAVSLDDPRQLSRAAERAGAIAVEAILGLLPSDADIEMCKIDFHGTAPNHCHCLPLYYISKRRFSEYIYQIFCRDGTICSGLHAIMGRICRK